MEEKEIDTTKTAISGLFHTKNQNKIEKYIIYIEDMFEIQKL